MIKIAIKTNNLTFPDKTMKISINKSIQFQINILSVSIFKFIFH